MLVPVRIILLKHKYCSYPYIIVNATAISIARGIRQDPAWCCIRALVFVRSAVCIACTAGTVTVPLR